MLYAAVLSEMAVVVVLVFKNPLRKLVIMGLDGLKRGTGPLVVKTVAGVIFVLMTITAYTVYDINSRPIDKLNPTDQVLLATNILQASLMGFFLFLSFMVDRLHHYIRELRLLRKTMITAEKQNRAADDSSTEELKVLGEEILKLKAKMKQLVTDCEAKENEIKSSEANVAALKNQSEGFMNEYNDLLEENRCLRDQIQSMHSD